jgi:hypothetical protein
MIHFRVLFQSVQGSAEENYYMLELSTAIHVFWNLMACSLVDMYQFLGETCYLHLKDKSYFGK